MTDQFRTPEANLIENTVYEECGESVVLTCPILLLKGKANPCWLYIGQQQEAEDEHPRSADMVNAVCREIVKRVKK